MSSSTGGMTIGASARALDRVDVRERHERGRHVPDPPARILRVRGDSDDRPHGASVSTIQSVPSPHAIAGPSAGSRLTRSTRTRLAVELGERATVAGNSGVEAPRSNLSLDLGRRS